MCTRTRRWMQRASVALFDALLRVWPADERREFGPSMRHMFARRLGEDRRPILAVTLRSLWELTSVVGLGISSRVERRRQRAGNRSLGLDARQALRSVLRRPRTSLLVVSTHALGLGLAVSAFAVFEATLLEPLPYPQGGRLVALWSTRDDVPTPWGNVSWLDLMDLRASSTTLAALGGHVGPAIAAVGGSDAPSLTTVTEVTPGFFETFGIQPEHGRLFDGADHEAGGVALVSHDAWVSRFGADPGILGRVVDLDDTPVRVVGVLPPVARFYPDPDVGFWLPYEPGDQSRGSRNLVAVGRLADDKDLAAASEEMLASLGATGARLVRPLLLEGLFLASAGGAAALVIARWLPPLALSRAPLDVPRAAEVGLDGLVLTFALAGTLLLTCLASLAPAWSDDRCALASGRAGPSWPAGRCGPGRRSSSCRSPAPSSFSPPPASCCGASTGSRRWTRVSTPTASRRSACASSGLAFPAPRRSSPSMRRSSTGSPRSLQWSEPPP